MNSIMWDGIVGKNRATKRVDELTPEQATRQLGEWRDLWIAIGLRAGETTDEDRARFERGCLASYEAAGLEPPREIVWCANPVEASRRFGEHLAGPNATPAEIEKSVRDNWGYYCGGQFWVSSWWGPARVTFLSEVCGLDIGDEMFARLQASVDVSLSASWWLASNQMVFVAPRPTEIHVDEQDRIHSTTGPAIAWPGFSIYAVQGTRVPARVVEGRATMTVADIDAERNSEVRRIMIELYGITRYVRDAKFDVIDTDTDTAGQPRRLLRRDDLVVVELVNSTVDADGTRRVYHEPVHPELRPISANGDLGCGQGMTALNAVASRYGMTGEEYAAMELET